MEDDQADRLIGAIRAQRLIMQGLAAHMLLQFPNPVTAAAEMRDLVSNRFVDEIPSAKRISRERESKINHYAAHFAEEFWTDVGKALAEATTGERPG